MQQQFQRPRASIRRALLAGTAFGALLAGNPGSALAACTVSGTASGGPNTVTCDTTVTTAATNFDGGFTTSTEYNQLFYFGGAVTGAVNAGQMVSGEGLWIEAARLDPTLVGAPVTFTNNGAVQGTGDGLHLSSSGGNIAYSGNGSASGGTGDTGLLIGTTGSGTITIGASGTPVVPNFSGGSALKAQAASGAIAVSLNGGSLMAMDTAGYGLFLAGNGNISATLTGNTTITNASGGANSTTGIIAVSLGGTVDITSNANIGSSGAAFRSGILASGGGAGNVSLFQTGGTIFADEVGVGAAHTGAGSLSVTTAAGNAIISAGNGIQAIALGTGAVNVTTAGTISAAAAGVQAWIVNAANASDVTVAANGNITGNSSSIQVATIGTGNLNVSVGAGATVQGTIERGVELTGGTANTVTNNGAIIGATGIQTSAGRTTVTNAGSITGTGGTAVSLAGANNLFIMSGPAATLTGQAVGSGTDTFRFAGSGNNSFDVSQIGAGWALLDKTGSSIWTLTGTSTYARPVTINGGTLSVASEANLGGVAGGLTFNGGILQITGTGFTSTSRTITWGTSGGGFDIADPANTFAVAQVLTGSGGLTKLGVGTLVLFGANTYTGATAVDDGTLLQGTAGGFASASAYTVASGATLDFSGFSTTIASLAGAGNVALGSAILTAGGDNSSTAFSGVISGGGGLTKVGTGRINLTGINTYSGATRVDAGTLSVNGSIANSAVIVNSDGTLGGNGTVGSTSVNGGTLAPGNSIGTLTVSGSLTMTAASTYLVQVSGATSDKTIVTGIAGIGGKVVVDPLTRLSATTTYTIMTAGTVSGTFSGAEFLTATSFARNARLSYVGNDVLLTLDPGLLSPSLPGNASINQRSVAAGIDNGLSGGGALPAGLNTLFALSGTPLLNALTQASGETATGAQQTTFNAMNLFMGLLTDPFVAGRGDLHSSSGGVAGYAADESDALAYAGGRKRSSAEREAYAAIHSKAPLYEPRWSVWAAGFGGSQTTDGNAALGSNTATSRIAGAVAGADYWFSPATVAGFALGGGGTNFSVANGGTGRSDLFQAGAFVRHNAGPAYVTGSLAYGWQDITTDRTVTIAGADHLQARFNANAWSGRLEGGYRFVTPWTGGVGVTPYAAAQFTTFDLPAYAESAISGNTTFALSYGSKSITATRSELGVRTDKSFALNDAILTLRGRAAWAHDFSADRNVAATFQALPGASFVVNGAAQAHDAALTTASAEMKFASGISLAATFEGEFSAVTRSYAGKGVVRYGW